MSIYQTKICSITFRAEDLLSDLFYENKLLYFLIGKGKGGGGTMNFINIYFLT